MPRFRMSKRPRLSPLFRKRILFFSAVFLLAAGVRLLTFNFLRARLNDASWFKLGSSRFFDKRGTVLRAGRKNFFWITDHSRTDLVQSPPAYPWMVATSYRLSGQRSAYTVQTLQSILDLVF